MKKILYSCVLLVVLTGCHNPKNTELPATVDQLPSIQEDISKLSDEERTLLASYMMRSMLSHGLLGGASGNTYIPPGTTIGQAIADQRKFVREQDVENKRQEQLKTELQKKQDAQTAQMRNSVTVTVVSKSIEPEIGYSGIVTDENLVVEFGYRNNTLKNIAGVKGTISIVDLFGDEMSAFNVSNDDTIKVGESSVWRGSRSVRYSLGNSQDRKWAELSDDKYKVVWKPDTIVFEDGSQIKLEK